MDGSSNDKSCEAGVVFEGLGESLILKHQKNKENMNHSSRPQLAYDMEAQQLICRSDSQLVVKQLKEEYTLSRY